MEQPPVFFSVILPTYNRAGTLMRAVNSVLAQNFSYFELIIIDDGSTDNTADLIKGLKDDRIKYIFQKNQERSAARNNGISNSIGKYICFLDSDDEFTPDYLKALHEFVVLKNYPIALIKSFGIVDKGGIKEKNPFKGMDKEDKLNYLFQDILFLPCAAVHRDILQKEKFDTALHLAEDTDLWVRILIEHEMLVLNFHSAIIHPDESEYDPIKMERSHTNYIIAFKKIKQLLIKNKLSGIGEANQKIILRSIWLARSLFDQKKYFKALFIVWNVYSMDGAQIKNLYFSKWLLGKKYN